MPKTLIKISLLISTYNWPEALELTLISISKQKQMPHEVIIADDGSKKATKHLIEKYTKLIPVPVLHIWHEDQGFRLAEIRNKAIATSSGNFIVQIDGDIIMHPKFIADYRKVIKPNYYYRGSRTKLSKELSTNLIAQKKTAICFFDKGLENRFNSVRNHLLFLIMNQPKKESKNALGCNMGFWRADLIKINGYSNNLTGWGHEDEELCARLVNVGVYKRRIKHKAIIYHIHHEERNKELEHNHHELIDNVIANKITRTDNGIDELS